VLTVFPLNSVALVAEGPITGCTISGPGKVTYVPTTGPHQRLLLLGASGTRRHQVGPVHRREAASMDVTIPATGNPTISIRCPGLSRTIGTAEVLTSPSAATTTNVLATALGKIVVNGW
jgi:hypothetical protein